jgi:predicted phosphodiesterase
MRIAIFSDLHNSLSGLQAVITDSQRKNADRLIYLGDAGNDPALFAALRAREISCTFGNWEVSTMRRLSTELSTWVEGWPAQIRSGAVIYTHATPDLPSKVRTTANAATYMSQGVGWQALFPRLNNSEEARWGALAALESSNHRAVFHGHTHVQEVWVYATKKWRMFRGPTEFSLEPGEPANANRYLIGVGSAGDPQDGPSLRYALYDDADQIVQLIALKRG